MAYFNLGVYMKKWEFRIKQYEYSLDKNDIQSRSKKNYEVKKDFYNKFVKREKSNLNFFHKKNDKIYFSLNDYIKKDLLRFGVKNIEIIRKDTYLRSNNFFSARRSLKNKLDDYGRNISVIMIK